jgi:hypothetical protein
MAVTLAAKQEVERNGESAGGAGSENIPPMIKNLLQDLSNIRTAILLKSPQSLPLIAPSLIEAEVHVRQLWQSQI